MRLVGLLLTACSVLSWALARRVAGMERAGRGGSVGAEEGARIAGRAGHGRTPKAQVIDEITEEILQEKGGGSE
jgi:hypothetical protein